MLSELIALFVGLAGLYAGGQWLVSGAARLAHSLGVSALIVGLTVVSIGTSMPELLVSVDAALAGSPDISIGNVVGSNIANIGLILGISGLIYPISVHVIMLRREIPIMLAVALLAYVLLRDNSVSRLDGTILLLGMTGFIAFMVVSGRKEQRAPQIEEEPDANPDKEGIVPLREVLRLVTGIAVLMIGAKLTVDNSILIARDIGVSELIIGMTLVAVGTSLPELVTSVMAATRRESDLAIGNVIGSNIFNILGILGATAIIHPMQVAPQIVSFDALVVIGMSLLVFIFVMNRKLERWEAMGFLGLYVAYIVYNVVRTV